MEIELLHIQTEFAVVNKPPGLLMHKSAMARDVKENLQDVLEEQLGKKVYLVHRLDRKTSGCVLVAFNSETASFFAHQFKERLVEKEYHAIVRGHLKESVSNSRSLEDERGVMQEAETDFEPVKLTELGVCSGKYPTTRLTFLKAYPKTGRTHQIRKHLAQLRHYIVNDKPHGDCKLNKAMEQQMNFQHMMLHARSIAFIEPNQDEKTVIEASYFEQFSTLLRSFED